MCLKVVLRCWIVFCFFIPNIYGQGPTQTIRGKVVDAFSGQPLEGASIQLAGSEDGQTTDGSGQYRFDNLPVGRYELQIRYLGYEPQYIPELRLESGKELVQNVQLQQQATTLDDVYVRVAKGGISQSIPVSAYTLTIEETLRFPGTFFDPARLATNMAGVVNDNDQANNMVIRGNSPNGLLWRLAGVDIVNPNHLTNAGTFSDRPSANGGGVNILSAQMLGASSFLTGAFPAEYGNALSGVLDMRLRKGNDRRREYTAQIGLLGLDVAAEGPLGKEQQSSYLLNYRYSTLGLFSALGIELGDEAINFQDLAFHVHLPAGKRGQLRLLGMGGLSENIFEAERDASVWEFEKDRQDIRSENKMGALGLDYSLPIGTSAQLHSTIVYSALETTRQSDSLSNEFRLTPFSSDAYTHSKLSFQSAYKQRFESQLLQFDVGLRGSLQQYDLRSESIRPGLIAQGDGNGWLLQPYLQGSFKLSPKLRWSVGLHVMHFTFNSKTALEPRTSLRYSLSEKSEGKQSISLAYGLHSQTQLPQLYFETNAQGDQINQNLDFTKAHHLVLSYQSSWKRNYNLRVELYYQRLFDVPISAEAANSFSALNLVEAFRPRPERLVNDGTGFNYGMELSWQKYFSGQYYFLLNGSLYESKYEGADGVERNTRFNGNYILNMNGGRDFQWNKKGKERILGVNLRFVVAGGFRDSPIDTEASAREGITIYDETRAFSLQQKTFFRPDLRLYYKNNKKQFSSTLSLDIQNVGNIQNTAYSYYDTQQQAIVVQDQLGLIPILSYRIEF
ncbi:MAG: TonB-dependent receptor [Bacteroidota bacterium]